jgi:hypothetical protein
MESSTFVMADHDRLHDGIAAKIEAFTELSRAYAARGEARMAQLAVWSADVQVLQVLLWESGLASAPDPDAQLERVGQAVVAALNDYANGPHSTTTARQAVENARAAMVSAFDESVHATLADRFVALDHLDTLQNTIPEGAQRAAVARRLAGRDLERLVADLQVTAADCMAVAGFMLDEGDQAGALHQAHQSDLASFEAYLLIAAVGVEDHTLATVDLRWDLAAALGSDEAQEVGEFEGATAAFRDRLVDAVGPAEEPALRASFEPLPFLPR